MEKNAKIRLIYGIFLGLFTVVLGVLFLAQAADIYYSGLAAGSESGMYSRAVVGKRLYLLLVPILLWAVSVAGGAAVYALFPVTPRRAVRKDDGKTFARLWKRADRTLLPPELRRYEKVRLFVRVFSLLFCAAAAVSCVVYLCNAANFTSLAALSDDVLHVVSFVMPWTGAALAVLMAETAYEYLSAKRRLPALKRFIAEQGVLPKEEKKPSAAEGRLIFAIRIAVFVTAALFLVLGVLNGGARDVLIKAINICTECIGLG